jgi:hypothetical protein
MFFVKGMSIYQVHQSLDIKIGGNDDEDNDKQGKSRLQVGIMPTSELAIHQKTDYRNQKSSLEVHEAVEEYIFFDVGVENALAFFERKQIFPHFDEQGVKMSENKREQRR